MGMLKRTYVQGYNPYLNVDAIKVTVSTLATAYHL